MNASARLCHGPGWRRVRLSPLHRPSWHVAASGCQSPHTGPTRDRAPRAIRVARQRGRVCGRAGDPARPRVVTCADVSVAMLLRAYVAECHDVRQRVMRHRIRRTKIGSAWEHHE
jgi:hypothetical protein